MSAGEVFFILLAVAFLLWRVRRVGRTSGPKGPTR